MPTEYEQFISRLEDLEMGYNRKYSDLAAKPFLCTIEEAGYELDSLPVDGLQFRVGWAFNDYGAFYGIPVVFDKDAPAVSIVLEAIATNR
ncbi:MAG: hypothetical protein ACYTEQ_06620 [Planctomycetota bacterium]|jgi:hypothetical protein